MVLGVWEFEPRSTRLVRAVMRTIRYRISEHACVECRIFSSVASFLALVYPCQHSAALLLAYLDLRAYRTWLEPRFYKYAWRACWRMPGRMIVQGCRTHTPPIALAFHDVL